jgi:hypothetical protein
MERALSKISTQLRKRWAISSTAASGVVPLARQSASGSQRVVWRTAKPMKPGTDQDLARSRVELLYVLDEVFPVLEVELVLPALLRAARGRVDLRRRVA